MKTYHLFPPKPRGSTSMSGGWGVYLASSLDAKLWRKVTKEEEKLGSSGATRGNVGTESRIFLS